MCRKKWYPVGITLPTGDLKMLVQQTQNNRDKCAIFALENQYVLDTPRPTMILIHVDYIIFPLLTNELC